MSAFDGEEMGLRQAMEMLNKLADKADLKLFKIQALVFLLSNKDGLNINTEDLKQASAAFDEIMSETDFKSKSFMNSDLTITTR